ncbi:MAG: hypothetical protein IJN32_03070 [Thermoguttaceae bacterium]|nr:hypothetical protein [Thermoguttaceae bacterium]
MSLHLKSSVRGPIHTDPYLRKARSPTSRASSFAVRNPVRPANLPRFLKNIGVFSAQLSGK